jgi:hypothetical protein
MSALIKFATVRSLAGIAAAVALATTGTATVAMTAPLSKQSVTLRADRFTFESWTSDDFQALADTLRATHPGTVELYACGQDAYPPLLAAARTLSDLPLQLHAMPANAPVCAAGSNPSSVSARLGAVIDEAAVARYWRQMMP